MPMFKRVRTNQQDFESYRIVEEMDGYKPDLLFAECPKCNERYYINKDNTQIVGASNVDLQAHFDRAVEEVEKALRDDTIPG